MRADLPWVPLYQLQFHETLQPWLSWFVFTPLGFRYIMFNGRTNGCSIRPFVERLQQQDLYANQTRLQGFTPDIRGINVNITNTKLLRKCHKTEWVRAYSPKLSRLRRQGRNYKAVRHL